MKISIVTVCFNSQKTISKTLESVAAQKEVDFEYIIIDGASTDNTLSIIADWQSKMVIKLISEPDGGIYDAMNKGVRASSGEFILFLNSDDYFYSSDSLISLLPYLNNDVDIVYGATEFRYNDFKTIRYPRQLSEIWKKMPFNHQSSLTSRSWLIKYPFNLNYKLAADYDFLINAYKLGARFKETDIIISSFVSGGASTNYQEQAIKEYEKILKKYGIYNIKIFLYYRLLFFKPLLKRLAPSKVRHFVYSKFVH